MEEQIDCWGWDDANQVWVKIQVDVNGKLVVVTV